MNRASILLVALAVAACGPDGQSRDLNESLSAVDEASDPSLSLDLDKQVYSTGSDQRLRLTLTSTTSGECGVNFCYRNLETVDGAIVNEYPVTDPPSVCPGYAKFVMAGDKLSEEVPLPPVAPGLYRYAIEIWCLGGTFSRVQSSVFELTQ